MINVESMDYTHSHPSTFASHSKYRAIFAGALNHSYFFPHTGQCSNDDHHTFIYLQLMITTKDMTQYDA